VRIVHAADSFAPDIGGIEQQVEALARRQQAQGHDVTVITAVHADTDDHGLKVVRASPGRWLTVAFPWRDWRRFARVLDSTDEPPIDVVHAHFTVISPVAIYVARAASRRGIPVAITVHSLWWQVAFATRLCTLPFGWGRIKAAWSGVSTVAAAHVRRTLPAVGDISVVPNLVDTEWWQPTQPPHETDGEVRLVLVGRLKKRKHVGAFIDALAEARRRLGAETAVRVSIVGDGPRRADLERQVQALGLADWVKLLGHREPAEIRALLHGSHLFVATSRQESFGIAALEARAAGLPVLGYRGNGLSDFVTHCVDGALVAGQAEMIDALTMLIGRRGELDRLRKTAATTPPSVSPDDAMAAVDRLYRRAITSRRHPRARATPP
jgi:glycosyltransferase involved in cell wall biosynthesis